MKGYKVKDKLKQARNLIRDSLDEIEVELLLIRNELRKTKVDKNKIISNIIRIEEVIR